MREIKFRAWCKTRRRMIDAGLQIDHKGNATDLFDPFVEGRQADLTLLQFTGLLDKNGIPIFEGDIVKTTKEFNSYTGLNNELYAGNVYEVKNNGWTFYLQPKSIYSPDFHTLEVIGNIYENPELLSKSV